MPDEPAAPTPTLAFIDTETTGLDPEAHEIWEVALILHTATAPEDREYLWQLPVDLGRADPFALNIGRFHERRWPANVTEDGAFRLARGNHIAALDGCWDEYPSLVKYRLHTDDMTPWALRFAELTWGAHLIGAVPSFDEERLRGLLRFHGACPGWHYQPIDVEAVVAGWLAATRPNWLDTTPGASRKKVAEALTLPWDSNILARCMLVDPDDHDRHTALGDARWARELWKQVFER